MNTFDRLQSHAVFGTPVIERVTAAAEWQNALGFIALREHYEDTLQFECITGHSPRKPIEIMTLTPSDDQFDESEATLYFLDHNSSISPDKQVRAMRFFASQPDRRLVVVGNPSSLGVETGKLSLVEAAKVYAAKSLSPTVAPVLRHLETQGVQTVNLVGSSLGAAKAVTAAADSANFNLKAGITTAVSPVNVTHRSLRQLRADFASISREEQWKYIHGSESQPLNEAWADDSWIKFGLWIGGLLRISNVAASTALAAGTFTQTADTALSERLDMRLSMVWGSDDEIVRRQDARSSCAELQELHGATRVSGLEIPGARHTLMDDPDLAAAVMLQAFEY